MGSNDSILRYATVLLAVSAVVTFPCAAERTQNCLVCGHTHSSTDHVVDYKGRKLPLCSPDCEAHYANATREGKLDAITAKIEPRSALFQADSQRHPLVAKDQLNKRYFWFGYFIVVGLICGGIAAYLAVQKGLSAGRHFAIGLIFNIPGVAFTLLSRGRTTPFQSAGLTKVPVTHSERRCQCGHANHPAACMCSNCGNVLTPRAETEVARVGLSRVDAETSAGA